MDTVFRILSYSLGETDIFAFHGNIDAQAETLLKDLPEKISNQQVILDFSQVGRINSMGIALLLRCLKNIKEKKKAEILVRELNQTNHLLFKMTGMFLLATLAK